MHDFLDHFGESQIVSHDLFVFFDLLLIRGVCFGSQDLGLGLRLALLLILGLGRLFSGLSPL